MCKGQRERTTLCGDDAAVFQGVVEKLEVGLLEEALSGTLRVRRVRDDDVEGVFVVVQEFEAIPDVHLDLGVVVARSHAREVLLGQADDGLMRFV